MKSNGKKAELAKVATPSGSSHLSENVSKPLVLQASGTERFSRRISRLFGRRVPLGESLKHRIQVGFWWTLMHLSWPLYRFGIWHWPYGVTHMKYAHAYVRPFIITKEELLRRLDNL